MRKISILLMLMLLALQSANAQFLKKLVGGKEDKTYTLDNPDKPERFTKNFTSTGLEVTDFHKAHMNQIVFFDVPTEYGKEDPAHIVKEAPVYQTLYAIVYLPEIVGKGPYLDKERPLAQLLSHYYYKDSQNKWQSTKNYQGGLRYQTDYLVKSDELDKPYLKFTLFPEPSSYASLDYPSIAKESYELVRDLEDGPRRKGSWVEYRLAYKQPGIQIFKNADRINGWLLLHHPEDYQTIDSEYVRKNYLEPLYSLASAANGEVIGMEQPGKLNDPNMHHTMIEAMDRFHSGKYQRFKLRGLIVNSNDYHMVRQQYTGALVGRGMYVTIFGVDEDGVCRAEEWRYIQEHDGNTFVGSWKPHQQYENFPTSCELVEKYAIR